MTFILNPTHEGAQRGEPVDYEFNQALIENPLVGLVGGALLMLVAVLMAITLLRYLILDGQLRRTGDVVQADVVETSAFVDPQDPDDIKDAVYTLTYAFSVGGETYQRTQDLLPSEYTQLRDAESVPVRYWPDDPALSRIAIASSERFNTGGVIALGLGAAIFGGTGIVLLRGWLLSAARWQRLAEDGQLVEATITGAELDESGLLTVHFRFTPPQGGPPVEASDSLRRPDLEAAPEPDTPAAVLAADRELYQLL